MGLPCRTPTLEAPMGNIQWQRCVHCAVDMQHCNRGAAVQTGGGGGGEAGLQGSRRAEMRVQLRWHKLRQGDYLAEAVVTHMRPTMFI